MRFIIADMASECFPEKISFQASDAASTERIKARVMKQIQTEGYHRKECKLPRRNRAVTWGLAAACLLVVISVFLHTQFLDAFTGQNEMLPEIVPKVSIVEGVKYQVVVSNKNNLNASGADTVTQLFSAQQGISISSPYDSGELLTAHIAPRDAVYQAPESIDLEEAEVYAWLDYETSSPEMKEKISKARSVVAFHSDWVSDGYFACVLNVETGETEATLPTFSDLFPGWDFPTMNRVDKSVTEDGLGVESLYGLSVEVIQTGDAYLVCKTTEGWNLFEQNQLITVYLPADSSYPMSRLSVGELVFVTYYGKHCSVAKRTISAATVEKVGESNTEGR